MSRGNFTYLCLVDIIIHRQCDVKRNKKNAKVMLGEKRLETSG